MNVYPLGAAALAVGVVAALLPDAALACRGGVVWSTGADVGVLKPGEVAVRAKLLGSYRGEQNFGTIMGHAYGMVYLVEVSEVIGVSSSAREGYLDLKGKSILVHSRPSICERYRPRKFAIDDQNILVLSGTSGFYELVGGQE